MATKQLNNVKILFNTNIGADKVLMKGEIGFETVNNRTLLKVGDGETIFSNLPYFTPTIESSKTITVTHDGTDSSSSVWATTIGENGAKWFIKRSEIGGTPSLIGGNIAGIQINNAWLNWNTAISVTMVDSTQTGCILINYQNQEAEPQPITRAVIVTQIGNYAFQGHNFSIKANFPETGIYLLNNSLYAGGNDYTASLSFDILTPKQEEECGNEIEIFNRGICIGDSVTEGTINVGDQYPVHKHTSYPSVLRKLTGADIVNAGIAGVTASQWVSAANDSSTQGGTWDENNEWVWSSSTSTFDYAGGYDFAIIHLGINDAIQGFNADSYYSSINTIINKLYIANPSIKFFLCTLVPNYSGTAYDTVNEYIRNNYSNFQSTYLIDLAAKSKVTKGSVYDNGHPSALGYTQLANDLYKLISASIKENAADYTTLADNTPSTIVYSGGNSVDNINTVSEEDVDVLLEKEV